MSPDSSIWEAVGAIANAAAAIFIAPAAHSIVNGHRPVVESVEHGVSVTLFNPNSHPVIIFGAIATTGLLVGSLGHGTGEIDVCGDLSSHWEHRRLCVIKPHESEAISVHALKDPRHAMAVRTNVAVWRIKPITKTHFCIVFYQQEAWWRNLLPLLSRRMRLYLRKAYAESAQD